MSQRYMCPSLGQLRRSVVQDVKRTQKYPSRAFHSYAARGEDKPSTPPPSTSETPTRKERSATALRQITSLKNQRSAPGSEMARFNPRHRSTQSNADSATGTTPLKFARNTIGPRTNRAGAPSPGTMVRGPNTMIRGPRGPNLRGRDSSKSPGGEGRPGNRGTGGSARRKKEGVAKKDTKQDTVLEDRPASETISDGMLHMLLRLQRKEWDRVPYEPKYAPGSFAANELIHAGRELFKGESPPVKIWGPLEKRIGVVGMHGAEAHLKIRRVPDGDAEPFGQEIIESQGKTTTISTK